MDRRRERREGRWKSGPLMASLLLHGAVVGLLALSTDAAPAPPKTKVYAVDIVSPPPNVAGAPPTEALSNQEPGPAAAAEPAPTPAAETPAPAPQPDPPAPDPEPAPPKEEAPKEPAKAPEPRRTPPQRPPQPAQRPSTTNPRPGTSNRPATPATTPATNRPATPEKGRTTPTRPGGPSTTGGTGSGPNRTRGDGTSTAPATGRNPQAGSPGGEGINIHTEGDPCPVAGYCERVTLQVQRYFRPPPGNASARGEVCFRIQRDGRVTDIQAQRVRGGAGAAFRLAMMEAAEAAGSRQAFGALPSAFDPQRWRWCVELSPR